MSPTPSIDPRVDLYIAKSKPFAQPILIHLRELVHKACPGVVETIKWSRPFFEYQGLILGNMSAFNEHCSFGFWGEEISAVLRDAKVLQPDAMGSLGRITHIKDLPANKAMLSLLRQATSFIDRGQYTSPIAAYASCRGTAGVCQGAQGEQKGICCICFPQPQLQAGVCRLDRRRQAH
jgi:hypothetical protein